VRPKLVFRGTFCNFPQVQLENQRPFDLTNAAPAPPQQALLLERELMRPVEIDIVEKNAPFFSRKSIDASAGGWLPGFSEPESSGALQGQRAGHSLRWLKRSRLPAGPTLPSRAFFDMVVKRKIQKPTVQCTARLNVAR